VTTNCHNYSAVWSGGGGWLNSGTLLKSQLFKPVASCAERRYEDVLHWHHLASLHRKSRFESACTRSGQFLKVDLYRLGCAGKVAEIIWMLQIGPPS